MKLTIGMPSYNNYLEVWMTVQALRVYHDLSNVEILVIDNFGSDDLKNFISGWCGDKVRYVRWTEAHGTAAAKNKVFEEATGEWVFCMDSHVMLMPGAISKLKEWCVSNPICCDLLQGPIVWDDLKGGADSFNDIWSSGMWGQWNRSREDWNCEPFEIPRMGMGLFGCRKDAWLGFNKEFRGFGGEEGYIHEKYRLAGRKTICLPFLQWIHYFRPAGTIPYTPMLHDKIRNYTLGFMELGLDMKPLYDHFGEEVIKSIENKEGYVMMVNWECPACGHKNAISQNLESKEGKVLGCANIGCRKTSVVNFQVSVTATAALVVTQEREKIVGEA